MKVRITQTSIFGFRMGGYDYNEITSELKKAGLPVIIGEVNEINEVEIYTEINTIDDINRLVKEFECHIVYSNEPDDCPTIEKYDTWRE